MEHEAGCVYVTGAGGFLGAAVVDALVARLGPDASRVVPLVREGSDARATGVPSLAIDLRERDALRALAAPRPRCILHLAAERPTSFAAADVERVASTNLAIDRTVFAFAEEVGAKVVYASGCSVYSGRSAAFLDEDAEAAPQGAYPAAKLEAEMLGRARAAAGAFPFVALRISAPYGPTQTARTVVHHFLGCALRGDDLTFHGSGGREQDFVHVDDVASAFVAATFADVQGVFHVASGAPITMRELAARVLAAVPESPSRVCPSGQPDPQEGLFARYRIERARGALGYVPRVSLDEGLRACAAARRGRT